MSAETERDQELNDAYEQGRQDMADEVQGVLEAPDTDDPVDTLRTIAQIEPISDDDYTYFDQRGEWVAYPRA